jgi:hypothetical protein
VAWLNNPMSHRATPTGPIHHQVCDIRVGVRDTAPHSYGL